jgi:hypothetical protein
MDLMSFIEELSYFIEKYVRLTAHILVKLRFM